MQVRLGGGRGSKYFITVSSTQMSSIPQNEWSGLMRAPFILQVFATHLNSIVGAEDIPGLEVTANQDDESAVTAYPPIGALALAATMVSMLYLCNP